MKITVVGLGNECDAVSLRGWRAVRAAERVIFKTRQTPLFEDAETIAAEDCDDLYETAADFAALDAAVVERVLAASETGTTAFCVPGDGIADTCVTALLAAHAETEIIPAAGGAQRALTMRPTSAYAVYGAYDVTKARTFDTDLPLVVCELDDALLAGDVKLHLLRFWSENTPVLTAEGETTLTELDRLSRYGADVCAVLLPLTLTEKTKFSFADLLSIMAVLTGADGCPWDRAQTHESIRANLVEEAYEAVEAIDNRDTENMVEEMGDVLLQAVFHGVIGEKEEEFDCGDILDNLCTKLLFRHPHVFGAIKAKDAAGALDSWETAKAREKRQDTLYAALCSIPKSFPQTLRAVKVAKRAAKAKIGADIDAATYRDVLNNRLDAFEGAEDKERALGECVYALANLARVTHIDPEIAAAKVIDGYVERFRKLEEKFTAAGVSLYDADEDAIRRALVEVIYDENSGR